MLGSAFLLQLRPLADGVLKQAPERAPKAAGSFAGYATFAAPQAGAYQVTLSAAGWIDLLQDGKYLKPTAFSGASDCPGVRKSVRFDLAAVPFTVQLSDVAAADIGLVVSLVGSTAN